MRKERNKLKDDQLFVGRGRGRRRGELLAPSKVLTIVFWEISAVVT